MENRRSILRDGVAVTDRFARADCASCQRQRDGGSALPRSRYRSALAVLVFTVIFAVPFPAIRGRFSTDATVDVLE
jgi:hypothetical protein